MTKVIDKLNSDIDELNAKNTVAYIDVSYVIGLINATAEGVADDTIGALIDKKTRALLYTSMVALTTALVSAIRTDNGGGTILWVPKSECISREEYENTSKETPDA